MSNYRRIRIPGGTYFFTICMEERRPIFADTRHIASFWHCLHRVRRKRPFEIDALVILPDHLHTIWRLPQGDSDFPTRIKEMKRFFSEDNQHLQFPGTRSKVRKKERSIWQRRYWDHVVRNADEWARIMGYIWWNPVKHGYVSHPQLWPHRWTRTPAQPGTIVAP